MRAKEFIKTSLKKNLKKKDSKPNKDMEEASVSSYGGNGRWMGKEFYRHLV